MSELYRFRIGSLDYEATILSGNRLDKLYRVYADHRRCVSVSDRQFPNIARKMWALRHRELQIGGAP